MNTSVNNNNIESKNRVNNDGRRLLATLKDGRVRFDAERLPLFAILDTLGGEPEGERKAFRCHTGDLFDVVENIGVHIDAPEVYDQREHFDLVDTLALSGTDLRTMKTMMTMYRALADKRDGYIYFEALDIEPAA